MGECPDWYPIIQAAKYLGCKPWELMEAPIYWQDKAIICISVENEAQKIINKRGGS